MVWFCLQTQCASNRHQKSEEPPLVPEHWPVAKGTSMSAEEVTTVLAADFEKEMDAGDPLEAQQEKQMHMYSRKRWGRVQPIPTKHTKAMQPIDEKVEKMIPDTSVSVTRTIRVGVEKVQWILMVE